jgi:hypothetical protein
MAKKEITKWEQVYQLPIKYDDMNYCWSKNGTMTLMFDEVVSEEDRQMIVKAVNGETELKMEGLTFDGCDFLLDGTYIFCVRGWGNLTGIGALNLPEEKALKIQDEFINHVHRALAKNTETKQCTIPSVVCSTFSNDELENMMGTWFDHYQANGESHYSDTPDFRIREIYWDKVVDRVIEDVNTEMTDKEVEQFCDRLADL